MSEQTPSTSPLPATPAQTYGFLCFLCLGVIVLADLQHQPGLLTLLKVMVGVFGVLGRRRSGAVLLLMTLGLEPLIEQLRMLGSIWQWRLLRQQFRFSDVLMAAGVLGYVLAHSRMLSLTVNAFPVETRRRAAPRKNDKEVSLRRSPSLATSEEFWILLLTVPVAALAGFGLWLMLSEPGNVLGFSPAVARVVLLLWVLGLSAAVVAGLLGHWRSRKMSMEEGTLHLQDVCWQETRREQRRQNQWLAWSDLPLKRRDKI